MTEHYTVTKDADRLAPNWLASRINYKTIKLLYRDKDGHAELKGVKIGDEVAQIGDTVQRQTVIRRKAVIQVSPFKARGYVSYFYVFFCQT